MISGKEWSDKQQICLDAVTQSHCGLQNYAPIFLFHMERKPTFSFPFVFRHVSSGVSNLWGETSGYNALACHIERHYHQFRFFFLSVFLFRLESTHPSEVPWSLKLSIWKGDEDGKKLFLLPDNKRNTHSIWTHTTHWPNNVLMLCPACYISLKFHDWFSKLGK